MPHTPAKTDLATPVRFDSIQRIVQNDDNVTPGQRRKLLKQQFRLIFELRQEQYKAALDIERERLGAQKQLATREMINQIELITLGIRQEYLKTIDDLGYRVDMEQLEFLTKFADDLKKFRQGLEKKDLDPEEKEKILNLSKKAFNRIADSLTELTENILARSTQHLMDR
ncbi:MAG: hypothetical protein MN733_07030 [Nitrososphaera sp.]|nr:hypothetical protein [Nitrososphaera sp.]